MPISQFINRIIPFIVAGITLVVAVIALLILSSVILWGALIGLIIFTIAYIKNRFFPNKVTTTYEFNKTNRQKEAQKGRIIDYDDIDR